MAELTNRRIREYCRYWLNVERLSAPVCIVDGFSEPVKLGESGYYTNKKGNVIHYPNAYRRTYGKPIYHHSTNRIEVGAGWLLQRHMTELAPKAPKWLVHEMFKFHQA